MNTEQPYFSLLLPTKNRAAIVATAIESALAQSFTDFELVIVDNDDSTATASVVKNYDDPRIRYFRTGNLNMVENWEFGRRQTLGKYFTVLEDKIAFYPDALKNIEATINRDNADVVVWKVDISQHTPQACAVVSPRASTVILDDYVNGRPNVWDLLPRIINSCISRSLMNKITASFPSGNFFNHHSPDIVAAFAQLNFADSVCYSSTPLSRVTSAASNGLAMRINKGKDLDYFVTGKKNKTEGFVSLVKIKNPFIIQNFIYNDYLETQKLLGGRLARFHMSDEAYSKICLHDTYQTLVMGGSVGRELQDIFGFMWRNLNPIKQIRLWFWWLRIVFRKLGPILEHSS